MTSTATTILGLQKQGTGDNSNSWGTVLNTQLDLIEEAVSGTTTISLASGDVTLTTTDYASNQARPSHLLLTGALGASQSVIVPAKSKLYCVTNSTTQTTDYTYTATVKTSAGTGVTVAAGGRPVWIRCDGTNVVEVSGLPSAHTATSTDVSVSTAGVQLTIDSADIVSDPYGMVSHATDTLVIPAGVELVLVQLNLHSSILDDTTALAAVIHANGFGTSPGSANLPSYWENSMIAAKATGNLKTTNVTALIYQPLIVNALNGGAPRGTSISFGARISTGTADIYGYTIDAVVLR
jgi:hypothetical protein